MCSEIVSKGREVILDSITEGVFTVDSNWRITSFNRAAEEITGIPRAKAVELAEATGWVVPDRNVVEPKASAIAVVRAVES